MEILRENVFWMGFNIYLAVLPLLFLWLAFHVRFRPVKWIFFLLWFLYLPNSIYVITDFEHILPQWLLISTALHPLLVLQYIALFAVGMWAYLVGFYQFEYTMRRISGKLRLREYIALNTLHLLMGFALVLGKIERINSWEVFSNPQRVINGVQDVFSSPALLLLGGLFGMFASCFYFLFRKLAVGKVSWIYKKKYHH